MLLGGDCLFAATRIIAGHNLFLCSTFLHPARVAHHFEAFDCLSWFPVAEPVVVSGEF